MDLPDAVINTAVSELIGKEMKYCSRCKTLKPIDEFHHHSKTPDGHQPVCKKCRAELDKIRNEKKKAAREEMKKDSVLIDVPSPVVEKEPIPVPVPPMKKTDVIVTADGRRLVKSESQNKPLSEYTNREILAELKKRGYVWSEMWIKQTIDYNKI